MKTEGVRHHALDLKKWAGELRGQGIAPGVRNILKYKKSGKVLDLGSGSGRHALFLAKMGFKVTAVDNAKEKIAELKQRTKMENVRIVAKCVDVRKFRASSKYDVVIATMLLHFFTKRQISEIVARIKSYTKPNGLNVVSVLTDKHQKGARPHLFKAKELKQYYKDWSILEYEEKLSKPFYSNSAARMIRQHRAALISQNV